MKKPRTAHQVEPLSELVFEIELLVAIGTPQLGHITALGSTGFPQLGQYFISIT